MRTGLRVVTFLLVALTHLLGYTVRQSTVLAGDAAPQILVNRDASQIPQAFEVTGLHRSQLDELKGLAPFDPAFTKLFSVTVVDPRASDTRESLPPIAGRYAIDGEKLTFTPRYPLQQGLTYRAELRPGSASPQKDLKFDRSAVELDVVVPAASEPEQEPATVLAIYPSANQLPENQLRFYIHFSRPMIQSQSYRHLQLLDESGRSIESAFLELGEELWDTHGSRFTLLLDPGRVKQGLKPREELGPVLDAGHKYTLVIKQAWRDENGQPLKSEFRKTFTAGPAVDRAIDWKRWKLTAPSAGSQDALSVEFDRSLDHALLYRALRIVDSNGQRIGGQIAVSDAEQRWKFSPAEKWTAGKYSLQIDRDLEDPVGNRVDRSFEIVRRETSSAAEPTRPLQIDFEIRSNSPQTSGVRSSHR